MGHLRMQGDSMKNPYEGIAEEGDRFKKSSIFRRPSAAIRSRKKLELRLAMAAAKSSRGCDESQKAPWEE